MLLVVAKARMMTKIIFSWNICENFTRKGTPTTWGLIRLIFCHFLTVIILFKFSDKSDYAHCLSSVSNWFFYSLLTVIDINSKKHSCINFTYEHWVLLRIKIWYPSFQKEKKFIEIHKTKTFPFSWMANSFYAYQKNVKRKYQHKNVYREKQRQRQQLIYKYEEREFLFIWLMT